MCVVPTQVVVNELNPDFISNSFQAVTTDTTFTIDTEN